MIQITMSFGWHVERGAVRGTGASHDKPGSQQENTEGFDSTGFRWSTVRER